MENTYVNKMKEVCKKTKESVSKGWSKVEDKSYAIVAVVAAALTPTATFAAEPSSYVNKITEGLFGQILKVAPKVALLVVGWAVLMYLISGDDHKKSKHKGTAGIALAAWVILIVLKPLMSWFDGLF